MTLEYTYITDFLSKGIYLKKGDYLYQHDSNEYPKTDEFTTANLYFVIENKNHNLKIHNMSNNNILEVDLNQLSGHWWILALPNFFRKQIGLE